MGSEGFLNNGSLVRTHRIGDTGISQKSTRKVRFFLENSMLDDDALFFAQSQLDFSDSSPRGVSKFGQSRNLIGKKARKYLKRLLDFFPSVLTS